MIHRLCKCEECGQIAFDHNPLPNQREYTDLDVCRISDVVDLKRLPENGMAYSLVCPNCETDEFIKDYNDDVIQRVYWLAKEDYKDLYLMSEGQLAKEAKKHNHYAFLETFFSLLETGALSSETHRFVLSY